MEKILIMNRYGSLKTVNPLATYMTEKEGDGLVVLREDPCKYVMNARDLGGMPVGDGKMTRFGRFIRSGRLYKLKEKGAEILRKLGVSKVVDLRMDEECREKPDSDVEGIEYIRIPLVCTATAGITHGKSIAKIMFRESRRIKHDFKNVDEYMGSVYENILFSEDTQAALRRFFDVILSNNDGCVLFHCAGGKDRAGLCAMLIEGLLGVGDEAIVFDYKYSRRAGKRKRHWSKLGLTVLPFPRRFRVILFGMMNAKESYILYALNAVKERYGSIENYCREALGITDEQIKAFREANLVEVPASVPASAQN